MRTLPAVMTALLFFVLLAVTGCESLKELQRGAAPTGAPGQSLAAKHRYRYYPDSAVYMDAVRKTFFYRRGEKWVTTTLLPPSVHVDWKNYVLIELDTDKPYQYHADISKKYPPAQGKIREGARTGK